MKFVIYKNKLIQGIFGVFLDRAVQNSNNDRFFFRIKIVLILISI